MSTNCFSLSVFSTDISVTTRDFTTIPVCFSFGSRPSEELVDVCEEKDKEEEEDDDEEEEEREEGFFCVKVFM